MASAALWGAHQHHSFNVEEDDSQLSPALPEHSQPSQPAALSGAGLAAMPTQIWHCCTAAGCQCSWP